MKFDMTKPCKDCPFIVGSSTNTTLVEGRLDGIVEDIEKGYTFTCHKTLELPSREQQHCAGALIYLEKQDRPNQLMRIAERFGDYDRRKLDMTANIIEQEKGY